MGLLPFFKGDLSGVSSGFWGDSACVFTLTSPTVDSPNDFNQWRASYSGDLKTAEEGTAAPDPVASVKVLQGPRALTIERRVGDAIVETAQLGLLIHGDGLAAGALSNDGKVKYLGSTQGGLRVEFERQVVAPS